MALTCASRNISTTQSVPSRCLRSAATISHGWGLMDGVENKTDGDWKLGSGFSMIGKFPRHPDGTNPDPLVNPYGVLGAAGGRILIPECDLMHVHQSGDSASSCAFVVDHIFLTGIADPPPQVDIYPDPLREAPPIDICGNLLPPVGVEYCQFQRCGDCTEEQPYDVNQRHLKFGIVIEEPPSTSLCGGWGDIPVDPVFDPLPVAAPGQACAAADPFGPLNIMNPYRNLYFIERLDNSQRDT